MGIADLLFPGRCGACGRGPWPLCPACLDSVRVAFPPWCLRCGRPAEEPLRSCADCPPEAISSTRAPFLYEGPVSRLVRGLKLSGWRALAPSLAAAMATVLETPVEAATWVPLAPRRRARRGFDQARLLAAGVARRAGLPLVRALARREETRAQATRSAPERRTGLEAAFEPVRPVPPKVLLVDDVLTTGSTAAACARALRRAGAEEVHVLVAARAVRGPVPARCEGRAWGGSEGGGRTL